MLNSEKPEYHRKSEVNGVDFDVESEGFYDIDLPPSIKSSKQSIYGSSHIPTESELLKYLNLPPDEPLAASLPWCGIIVEDEKGERYARYSQQLYLSEDIRQRGLLCIGQPGAGKTQKIMLPLVASEIKNPNSTIVFLASKGNEYDIIRLMAKQYRPDSPVHLLSFSDASRSTVGWNPFASNGEGEESEAMSDIISFCEASHTQTEDRDSVFWDTNASRLLVALKMILQKLYGHATPAAVHELLELPHQELVRLLRSHSDVKFSDSVGKFIESDSHNALTVLATAQGYMRIFCDENLAAVTSQHTLHFRELLEKPSILVLEFPQHAQQKIRPVLNMFFNAFFREICLYSERLTNTKLTYPLCLFLDDFAASLGRIPGCGEYLTTLRSRDVRTVVALQETRQLVQFYSEGEAAAIMSAFSSKIFIPPVSIHDAEIASQESGEMTVTEVHTAKSFHNGDVTKTVIPCRRMLFLPSDIRRPVSHLLLGQAASLFFPDVPPFQAWIRSAYDTPGVGEFIRQAQRENTREVEGNIKNGAMTAKQKFLTQLKEQISCISTELPQGITNTSGMSEKQIQELLDQTKKKVECEKTTGSAKKWWIAFEEQNKHRAGLILRLAEELAIRNATITEFFLAYIHSNTDSIQGNLHFLDYTRLKNEEEKRKLEDAKKENSGKKSSSSEFDHYESRIKMDLSRCMKYLHFNGDFKGNM